MTKATDRQVGGRHYDLPIQPIEFIVANEIPYIEAAIIKYAVRHRDKGGVEDLDKIIHYAQLAKELYYEE